MIKILKRLLIPTDYQLVKTIAAIKTSQLPITREYIFAHRLMRNKDFFFIQIGANDGIMCDDIYEFVTSNRLPGLVVEPLSDMFQKLRENYAEFPMVTPVKKAIFPSGETVRLHRVKPEHNLRNDLDGIASLSKDHHIKSRKHASNLSDYMIEEEVPCIHFQELIKSHEVKHIDLLQIDTEGFDFEIIKMIDFGVIKPSIIRYEYKHLSDSDHAQCIRLLKDQGYLFHKDSRKDMIAYLEQ